MLKISQTQKAHKTQLFAEKIITHFKHTEPGHCVRVDFLRPEEALQVCQYILEKYADKDIEAFVLTPNFAQAQTDSIFITTDKAIELRNRKEKRLCLFVPSDMKDSAYSSLSNSFALVDARELQKHVLRSIQARLKGEASQVLKAVFAQLRGIPGNSDELKLDFAAALWELNTAGKLSSAGLELWRVGLIVDAGEDFQQRLSSNHSSVLSLSRPSKLDATPRERIQTLKVNHATATQLGVFFRGRSMNDVREWSLELTEHPELTFDRWVFPQEERSDLREVKIKPFVNAKGELDRYCKLLQPDGAGGSLMARCGPKETLVVKWECEPKQPSNLSKWRISILPSDNDGEREYEIDLPERDIAGDKRSVTLKLDIDFDRPPDFAVCVRIMPLKADGSEIRLERQEGDDDDYDSDEENKIIYADSREFFLVKEISPNGDDEEAVTGKTFRTIANLAFGRLESIVETTAKELIEEEPIWISKDLDYFSLRINSRRILTLGLSRTLHLLEAQVIAEPRRAGCFTLDLDEVRRADFDDIQSYKLIHASDDIWNSFWRARETFFKRLKQGEHRSIIETADWNAELAGAALRYAQTYQELVDRLIDQEAEPETIRDALSIDTLLVRLHVGKAITEETLLILPTHPLRLAWMANYSQLLRVWEQSLFTKPSRERRYQVDLQALRQLAPTNVPTFAFHAATTTTFTFFQNLRFFHGVALPVGVPDPHRRYTDLAKILEAGSDQMSLGDVQPGHLTEHLRAFQDMHPYTSTLVITLVNPDRGEFFARAIEGLILPRSNKDDSEEETNIPLFQIHAYMEEEQTGTLSALDKVRQTQADRSFGRPTDHFQPGLAITSKPMRDLDRQLPPEAHIAVITDFTRPTVTTGPDVNDPINSSFSLYGLVCRFISQFNITNRELIWQHQIITEGIRKPEPHPAEAKYSKNLIDLHTTLLNANGYLLSNKLNTHPIMQIQLEAPRRALLERLHNNTNWVITLDRFFTLDYYDSPHEPGLDDVARKYVLDYAPEFTEGLGHRMMVTTAWHEEINSLLGQAMNELGFSDIDESVGQLLHYLKTISGRLALQAIESSSNAPAAIGLGVVTAWLQKQGRLRQAILVPVDVYPRLFSLEENGRNKAGVRRCDLILFTLKRNLVEATFIEVKWRRGRAPLEELSKDMVLQMKGTEHSIRRRFFDEQRIDGALQRSYLANVLRFYFERSRRYKLFDPESETTFMEHITRLEKSGLVFRPSYEGYIVSLEDEQPRTLQIDGAKITVLTGQHFADASEPIQTTIQDETNSIISTADLLQEIPLEEAPEHADFEEEEIISPDEYRSDNLHSSHMPYQEVILDDDDITAPRRIPQNTAVMLDDDSTVPQRTPQTITETSTEAASKVQVEQQPPSNVQDVVIPLGTSAGKTVNWQPSVKGSPHLFILGIPGQGKSWTTTRILSEMGKQQVPALVLDFHGQFADPEEPFLQAVQPNVLDAAEGLPFSPFECAKDDRRADWRANALAIAEIFGYVTKLGPIQQDVLYTAIQTAYRAHGFGSNLEPPELSYPTLAEVLALLNASEQNRNTANVTARCRPLLEMDLFQPAEDSPDLLSLIHNGLVIDLHNLYSESLQIAAGAFVLRKIYRDMFHWGQADHLRLAIVLDEAHRLAKDITLPKLMKEGRKFGISVIVASQGLADFHPDILGNVGTKVIFRTNYPDSKKVAGFIKGRQNEDLVSYIEQLSVGSAYVQTPDMLYGSIVKMFPLK